VTLLGTIYTDDFRKFVNAHQDEKWHRFLTDLQADIDDQFIKLSASADKDHLHILSQQRIALQELLTALTTTEE